MTKKMKLSIWIVKKLTKEKEAFLAELEPLMMRYKQIRAQIHALEVANKPVEREQRRAYQAYVETRAIEKKDSWLILNRLSEEHFEAVSKLIAEEKIIIQQIADLLEKYKPRR